MVERSLFADLEAELRGLRAEVLAAEAAHADAVSATHPTHRRSAANLVHYLELRRHDIRELQAQLAAVGLSSLGRSESAVLASLDGVVRLLALLTGGDPSGEAGSAVGLSEGQGILSANADRLLGSRPATRSPRIMVTLPTDAAADPALVTGLTASGMDLARVNCAHDDAGDWQRMIANVRATRRPDGHRPRVAMDLAGPKVRTGPLEAGPRVIRVAPRRDSLGDVVAPARVWITDDPTARSEPGERVVVVDDGPWLERRRPGDRLELVDSRGAVRHWTVLETAIGRCLATARRTAYVASGLRLVCQAEDGDEDPVTVGGLPQVELVHRVERGDRIVLTRSLEPATPTPAGAVHRIGCTLPEVFDRARRGERVWLDDGKFGGTIERVGEDEIEFVVTDVRPGGANLKAGKGINFPDTDLQIGALTDKDITDLDFVARHADIVNVSFVRHAGDVEQLQAELERLGAGDVGIVFKIENVAAFEHLPELLLVAMRSRDVGVMIARGDLAVEVGFERMAEVQEEILWICEAAHVPVIWATQVLDTLARTGRPSRAEVTDAAMAERAECVMLNKGPHITEAIAALDSILCRMQHHQHKKRSLLRRLHAWDPHDPVD